MKAEPVLIREMKSADAAAVHEIQGAAPEAARWHASDYESLGQRPDGLVLVAERAESLGAVLGFVAAQVLGEEAEIQNLAIRADHRRHGVARRLIETLHRRLAGRGVNRVFLEVRVSNLPARNLYRVLGYSECGLRKNYYVSNGEDALVLNLRLSAFDCDTRGQQSKVEG